MGHRAYAPWAAPLFVGLGLRIVAALVGFGWFAPDDYHFVIEQSGHWLQDPGASFPCAYRSVLLPRLFWLCTAAATKLGLDGPTARLRCAYLVLGLVSTAVIPAVYKLAARHADPLTARTAAWLSAAFFLLPRISTRPLIESASMVPLAWGALWLDRARGPKTSEQSRAGQRRRASTGLRTAPTGEQKQNTGPGRASAAFLAALLIGTACLFRFQAGVLVPAVLVLLASGETRRESGMWFGLLSGAVATAALQAALDASEGRGAFATPLAYLEYNLGYAHTFGESPWYTYLGHFLAFTLPPATLALCVPLVRALRQHVVTAALFCTFVGVHSLIGHKEDRFMFPVLPLFFVLLAGALEAAARQGAWRTALVRLFWVGNAVALVIATCSDAQRSLTRPFLHISSRWDSAHSGDDPMVATVGLNLVPRYYLGDKGSVENFDNVGALLNETHAHGARFDFVLLRHPSDAASVRDALACGQPKLFHGDWLDQVLVRVNRHNERRDATALLECAKDSAKNSAVQASVK